GEFQLAGGFERDRGAVLEQGHDLAVLVHTLPAIAAQPLQQRADAALALVGRRAQVVEAEAELLVLGADAPVGRRLAAGGEIGDEFIARCDRGVGTGAGIGHVGGLVDAGGRAAGRGRRGSHHYIPRHARDRSRHWIAASPPGTQWAPATRRRTARSAPRPALSWPESRASCRSPRGPRPRPASILPRSPARSRCRRRTWPGRAAPPAPRCRPRCAKACRPWSAGRARAGRVRPYSRACGGRSPAADGECPSPPPARAAPGGRGNRCPGRPARARAGRAAPWRSRSRAGPPGSGL